MYSKETKDQAIAWLREEEGLRWPKTRKELCKKLGIRNRQVLTDWEKELKPQEKFEKLENVLMGFTDEEIEAFKRHVYDESMKPKASPQTMKLLAQLQGLLEPTNINIKIGHDAGELARIEQEYARREREFKGTAEGGMADVQTIPNLLSSEVCKNKG